MTVELVRSRNEGCCDAWFWNGGMKDTKLSLVCNKIQKLQKDDCTFLGEFSTLPLNLVTLHLNHR